MRFTDKGIAALKAKKARHEVWEDGRTGLGVRVSSIGRKSWVYMFRYTGKARRMTLGTYPALSLADARIAHSKAKKKLEQGVDPGAELVGERQAVRDAATVKDLIEEYLEKYARPNKRSADYDQRALETDVLPVWGKRKAKDISRRDVIILLDKIVERGSPTMANRTLKLIRTMFNFAITRDLVDASPCVMIPLPTKETPRDRVLSSSETKLFWDGLANAKMSEGVRLSLKLMLATSQRREEVTCAPWTEFDLENEVWEIPGTRTKNGTKHRVPLSRLSLDLLVEIREQCDGSKWLFPSPRNDKPITPGAVSHALRNNLGRIGVQGITAHDLRRTAASSMTELGIPRLVVAKLLNHSDKSITSIYDRHSYGPEKRHALDAWGARLQEIISGQEAASNVVELQHG